MLRASLVRRMLTSPLSCLRNLVVSGHQARQLSHASPPYLFLFVAATASLMPLLMANS